MNLVASLIAQFALGALQQRRASKPLWVYLLGIFFLALGGVFGCYFLFQYLVPLIGYIETGMLFSGFFIICGAGFFIVKPKKKADQAAQIIANAKTAIDKIDVSDIIQKHSGKIMIGAVVIGAILSQFLGGKDASAADDEESK